MTPEEYEARRLYGQLQPGDRVEVMHGVTVGSSAKWSTTTVGKVLRRERRRRTHHGDHGRVHAVAPGFLTAQGLEARFHASGRRPAKET